MAIPGGIINPIFDSVGVTYELINFNTLQPISHTGNYAQVNSNQFISLRVQPTLSNFDKRINKVLLTFKQYTNLSYEVSLCLSNSGHFISSVTIPLRVYSSSGIKCYEADITDLISSDPTKAIYLAITTSSSMSFYVNGINRPSASIITYSVSTGLYSPFYNSRLKNFSLRNYYLDVDLFSLNTFSSFDLFNYENELLSFNLSLVHSFTRRNTSNISETIVTGFPNGFKLNVQQYIYQTGTRTYAYIDENFFTHIFTIFTNDDGTFTYFYDENGSYLLLEVLANGYKIYDLNGNVKFFDADGYITSQTIINGNNQSTISYSYTNHLLTSININNDISISINYGNNPIVITLPTHLVSSPSSISISYDVDNYLVSLIDQEGVEYSIYYHSEDDGLIEEVIVDGESGISLSFNNQLMVEDVSYYEYDDYEPYECNATYYFWSNTLSTKYDEDCGFIYSYTFTSNGEIKSVYSYRENDNDVLSANAVFKNNQFSFFLSTDKPNYLSQITYTLNGTPYSYSHFENSINFTYAMRFLNFTLIPKGKGYFFLYFEYGRNHITNYQTLNALTLTISVVDNDLHTHSITLNEPLDTNCFDNVNVYLKEITFPDYYQNPNVKLYFKLSSGETEIFIKNIRLYYFDNKDEHYGINFNTAYDDQHLESENESFYDLPDTMTLQNDSLIYSFSTNYYDILASLLYRFYLNKNVVFYNSGMNACFGAFTYNNHSLNTIKLSKTNRNITRDSNGYYLYNGYTSTISSFDNDCFIEKTVQYENDFHTVSFNEKRINANHLIDSEFTSVPNGKNGSSYYKYQLLKNNYCNNYGLLTNSTIMAYDDTTTPLFEKASPYKSYSSDNKYLTGINQKLYIFNQQQNDISANYQFNGVGDLSSKIDAYNKTTTYKFNKFHLLKEIESYNLSCYHINSVNYDKSLNVSSMKDTFNQLLIQYSYASDGELTGATYDNLDVSFSKNLNSRTITYSDGNQDYSLTSGYSDFGLPLFIKVNNNTILSYHYTNKRDGSNGFGNPNDDQLSYIYDYKDTNNTRIKSYEYDYYGNVNKITENGIELDIVSSFYPQDNENDCGLADEAIKTSSVYKKSNDVFRIENNYYLYSDPNFRFKTIHDDCSFYAIRFSRQRRDNNGSSDVTISTINNSNNTTHKYINSFFDYYVDEYGRLTSFPIRQTITFSSVGIYCVEYSYNNNGNLSGISSNGFSINVNYTYDMFNQLSSENDNSFGQIDYQYDSRGNITGKTIYSSSTVYSYYYDNYNRLTHFVKTVGANNSTTYYCSNYVFGRPSTYKNKTLQWDKNELVQYDNVYFTYDGYGRRIKKITPNRVIDYIYIDNLLLEEIITENNDTKSLRYLYDTDNNAIGFIYNSKVYFYIKDILNNVIAIYDQDNHLVCRYNYDAYGNHNITWWDEDDYAIALVNPIRYRSYYFDTEINLYYLKSRYYDSETCRFISMDDLAFADPNTINGLNLYAYCFNNPVAYSDSTGHNSWEDFWSNIGQWFKNNWVELTIGASAIAIGALTMGAGALVAGAGFAGALAVAGTAALQSLASAAISAAIGGLISGGISTLSSGDFWKGFGNGVASGFMWGGIAAGVANVFGGALTITRALNPSFNGFNLGSIRVWSPNSLNNPAQGGTLVRFGKLLRIDSDLTWRGLGLHIHLWLSPKAHIPVSWVFGILAGLSTSD